MTAELLGLPNFTHLKYMQGVLIQYLFDYLMSSYKEWNPQINQKVILQLKKYRTHCQQFNEKVSFTWRLGGFRIHQGLSSIIRLITFLCA